MLITRISITCLQRGIDQMRFFNIILKEKSDANLHNVLKLKRINIC